MDNKSPGPLWLNCGKKVVDAPQTNDISSKKYDWEIMAWILATTKQQQRQQKQEYQQI
jgi:hypothetical protein